MKRSRSVQPGRRTIVRSLALTAVVGAVFTTAVPALSSTAVAGSEPPSSTADAPTQSSGVVRIGLGTDVLSFDPYSRALSQFVIAKSIYDSLIELDEDLQPVPRLATDWTVSDDMTSVDLTLRDDVTFHGGSKLTAAAVVANFERAMTEETGTHMFFFTSSVESATEVSENELTVTFKQPTPPALMFDILQGLSIVDPEYFDKLDLEASGTGPYRLVQREPGVGFDLVAFEDWWGGVPNLEAVEFTVVADPDARVAAVQSGDLDVAEGIPPRLTANLDNLEILQGFPGALYYELRLNPRSDVFSDQAVRQGMLYGIDRQGIVDTVLNGYSTPAVTPLFTHSDDLQAGMVAEYALDGDRVQEAFAAADGEFTILISSSVPELTNMAEILQATLQGLSSVQVDIEVVEPAAYTDRLVAGDFDATVTIGSGGHKFPSQITFGSAWRLTGNALWGDDTPPTYAAAIDGLLAAFTPEDLVVAIDELNAVILDLAIVQTIADRPTLFAYDPAVEGLRMNIDNMLVLDDLAIA